MNTSALSAVDWRSKPRALPFAVVLGSHLLLGLLAWQATGRAAEAPTVAIANAAASTRISIVTVSLQPQRAAPPPIAPTLPPVSLSTAPAMRPLAPPSIEIEAVVRTDAIGVAAGPLPPQPPQQAVIEPTPASTSTQPASDAVPEQTPMATAAVVQRPSSSRDASAANALSEPSDADPPRLIAAHADRRDCPPAPHPAALRDRGIEGVVRLMVRVDAEGRASEVRLQQASGFRLFDRAALEQARGCRFVPARRGALPVESWVEFPVRFTLRG